ncbi:hypothetical protein [Streptomyces sp. NPDC101165]
MVAIAALSLVVMAVNWLLAHWWLPLAAAALAILGSIGCRQQRTQPTQ